MSRYSRARVELEQALLGRPLQQPSTQTAPAPPKRYAAISVKQPWAWLLAHAPEWPAHVLGKTVENRSRATGYRGPLLIHVSRTWEDVGETLLELRRLGLVGRGCPEPNVAQLRAQLGQVIAVGELEGCRRVGSHDPHPWANAGAWAWEIGEVELVRPFGLRGHRGLWFAPDGIEVVRLPRKLELGGLPAPIDRRKLPGLHVDSSSGATSIEVRDHREAVRVLTRAGVRNLGHQVLINGSLMPAAEVLARAAVEFGDPAVAQRIRARIPHSLAPAAPPSLPSRGPRRHRCAGGGHD